MQKKWILAQTIDQETLDLFPQIDPIILQLLFNRGLKTQKEIDDFLNPDYLNIHDPFLIGDMNKAIKRIIKAIKDREKITVYGDYDADGVCGTTLLINFLKLFKTDTNVYIPHRENEGYGLNKNAIEQIAKDGCQLLITNDCGISNKSEVELANELGIQVIITDHHHPPHPEKNLPPAYAIIHPRVRSEKYPFKSLAGAGSVFKLIQGLIKFDSDKYFNDLKEKIIDNNGSKINWEGYEKWILDLVCLATITDSMPLLGENRTIVKFGLIVLNKTKRKGLKELMKNGQITDKKIDTHSIGFVLGPRINAAGRMDHASVAYELMISDDDHEAEKLAEKLEKTNKERQKLVEKVLNEADAELKKQFDNKKTILIAFGDKWPTGILGLVAGRLSDKYYRPVILMTNIRKIIDGSARSIDLMSIMEVLEKMPEFFERFGGHAAAAGFSLKKDITPQNFIDKIDSFVTEQLKNFDLTPILELEAEITLDKIDWRLWESLEKFEPYGKENPQPIFCVKGATLVGLNCVGAKNNHLKIAVRQNRVTRQAIGFSLGKYINEFKLGDKVDLACSIDINEWNGNRELQLKITDINKTSDHE